MSVRNADYLDVVHAYQAEVERLTWQQEASDNGYRLQVAHAETRAETAEKQLVAIKRWVILWQQREHSVHSGGNDNEDCVRCIANDLRSLLTKDGTL